ncbi:MAG: 2-amino-4-hydroxy-6-hydroxymethyldihydropteridine diphosphokinase [Hyphomicrobiales bacterium]|nr:2-amino-4-hydroxy-6-hydroxymethyldihydropteridine diphosphokinase [Hyphomicrobiales bacterium]
MDIGLGLGGNVGDVARHMREALSLMETRDVARIEKVSSLWRTPPWGNVDQPPFLNACALAKTTLQPYALLAALKQIEADLGRQPTMRWGPRVIDLDILFYGETAIDDPKLTLPHKEMLRRAFVLAPLAEIAPDRMIAGESVAAALRHLDMRDLSIAAPGETWRRQDSASKS